MAYYIILFPILHYIILHYDTLFYNICYFIVGCYFFCFPAWLCGFCGCVAFVALPIPIYPSI